MRQRQVHRDRLVALTLLANPAQQVVGADLQVHASLSYGQDSRTKHIASIRLAEELMLRSQPLEFGETSLQGFDVKLAPEGEMVHLVL